MNVEEAKRTFNRDLDWLTNAGFLDSEGNIVESVYNTFMAGKLPLKPEVEINIQRRLERFQHLADELAFIRWQNKNLGLD